MFNPKQALQKIRRNKTNKDSPTAIVTDQDSGKPLFDDTEPNDQVQNRLSKLQAMVSNLSEQLSISNEAVNRLKRENNHLETQMLKLDYENSQLKSSHKAAEYLHQSSSRGTLHQGDKEPKKQESRIIDEEQPQKYSAEVEEVLEQLKQQPIDNLLKRKENNFRALRSQNRQVQVGNRLLKDLAFLEKNHQKSMEVPTLVIQLEEADFD